MKAARVALRVPRRCAKDRRVNLITASVVVQHMNVTLIGSTKIGEYFCFDYVFECDLNSFTHLFSFLFFYVIGASLLFVLAVSFQSICS